MSARTAGYVLVGGRSSRFGSDKALLAWEGRPLAVWVAEQVLAAAGDVVLVGAPERYEHLGLPVIADPAPGSGPLGGLAAVLGHTTAEWNLVVACDLPLVTAEFLTFLTGAAGNPADVVLPLDRDGRDEPLCAVYASRCRAAIEAAFGSGVRKVTEAFGGLRVRRMAYAEYARFDPAGKLFTNVNTAGDLPAARVSRG